MAPSPKVTTSTITNVLQVSDYGNGKYQIKDVPSDEATFPDLHSGNRRQFDFPLPIPTGAIVGYVDIDDNEIGIYLTIAKSQVGPKFSAGLDTGVTLGIDIFLASGSVTVFKSGKELKGKYSVSIGIEPFRKSHSDEFHILDL